MKTRELFAQKLLRGEAETFVVEQIACDKNSMNVLFYRAVDGSLYSFPKRVSQSRSQRRRTAKKSRVEMNVGQM